MDPKSSLSAPTATATSPTAARRLPVPPPPEVVVRLSAQDWLPLDRLTKLTGHDAGEAAALLLDECLCSNAAVPLFQEAARMLRVLYTQRRHELSVISVPSAESTGGSAAAVLTPAATETKPRRIHVPLSKQLNQRLYCQAMDCGLNREGLARELLMVAIRGTHDLVDELERKAAQLKNQNP